MILGRNRLVIGFTSTHPGAGRRTHLRARGSFVSVRVPLSKIRMVNCVPHASLPRTTCGTRGSVAFCRKLTASCLAMGPNVFTVFFPRSTRTPNMAPSKIEGIVMGMHIGWFLVAGAVSGMLGVVGGSP